LVRSTPGCSRVRSCRDDLLGRRRRFTTRRDATRRTDERRDDDDGIADDDGTTGSPTSVRSVRSRFRTDERTNDDASELEEYFVSSLHRVREIALESSSASAALDAIGRSDAVAGAGSGGGAERGDAVTRSSIGRTGVWVARARGRDGTRGVVGQRGARRRTREG